MCSPPASSVRIEPTTDPSELSALASIFDVAMKASGDRFYEAMVRYVEDPYIETMKRLQAALSAVIEESPAEQHFLLKAVETSPRYSPGDGQISGGGNPGGLLQEQSTHEKIVGMAHWTVGYIDLPKLDPFEQQAASAATSVSTEPSVETLQLEDPIYVKGETATSTKPEPEPEPFDFYAVCRKPVRNAYISQIRGKKHVCESDSLCLKPDSPVSHATTPSFGLPSLCLKYSQPFPSSHNLQTSAVLPFTRITSAGVSHANSYNGASTAQTRRGLSVTSMHEFTLCGCMRVVGSEQ